MSRGSIAALLLCVGLCAGAQVPDPASNAAAQAARRDLWLGDEGRYVRRWVLLGPVPPAAADEIARAGSAATRADATRGAEHQFADHGSTKWRAQGSYGDILDGFSAAGMKDGDVGFAL